MNRRLVRRIGLLVCGLFLLGLLFSLALAAEHGGHCGHQATCSACQQLQVLRALLKQLMLALAAFCALAMLRTRGSRAPGRFAARSGRCSPVALKVRMNN